MDIIDNWAYIEADFQREYGIDLVKLLPEMSWRRFFVLLQGLSPNSVFVLVNSKDGKESTTTDDNKEKIRRIMSW